MLYSVVQYLIDMQRLVFYDKLLVFDENMFVSQRKWNHYKYNIGLI